MNADRDKNSRERVRTILSESVSVLCRTMLQYDAELSIRGLLGITVDNRDVFLVDILETVHGRNHDVSDVAVIDPGKEDSEGDMLVVDDSDIEEKHSRGIDKAAGKGSAGGSSGSNGSADARGGCQDHGGMAHGTSGDGMPRHSLGLKELGDAAWARSLNHIHQLASKSLMKSSLGLSAPISRSSDESGAMAEGTVMTATQVLTTSTGSQAESEQHSDPNFRLQQEQDRADKVDSGREQHPHDQPSTMYALCACENTGDASDCAIKQTNGQVPPTWNHGEAARAGEYVQAPSSVAAAMASQSPPVSAGHVHGCNVHPSALSSHDPYQMWNKANNNNSSNTGAGGSSGGGGGGSASAGGNQATTSSWQTMPPPASSSVPTTSWPGPAGPQQQGVSTSASSTETMAAAGTAPIQSLYSSLPETISSALLHTTYTQGNTPKNLRGEGVFPCKLCSRVFTYKKSKARHMKRHLGEFFTCDVCKKTFCRKDVLARHHHNVHGVKAEAGASAESDKSPAANSQPTTEEPATISLLSQSGEVAVNAYSQTPPAGAAGRNFEGAPSEFSAASTHLTVPRPPLAVVTSIPQPIQSFLTLNHSAIPTHQTTDQQVAQSTLHHGTSPQT